MDTDSGRDPMPSSRKNLGRRLRPWLAPVAGLVFALLLTLVPLSTRRGIARGLEYSLFLPYRFALGWGPRSLIAQREMSAEARSMAERLRAWDGEMESSRENDRLRRLLGFQRRAAIDLVAATVVGRGRARFGDLLIVDPERPVPDLVGMVAVTPDGLLGRVASRDGPFARVECLTNPNVAVSVVNQRSREGGILKWNPAGSILAIEGVPAQADWQIGDRVVTSGLGAAFPRGILAGWVRGQRAGRGGVLQTILIRPAAASDRVHELFLLHARDLELGEPDRSPPLYPMESRSPRAAPADPARQGALAPVF